MTIVKADREVYLVAHSLQQAALASGQIQAYGSTWDVAPMPTMSLFTTVTELCERVTAALGVEPVTVTVGTSPSIYKYRPMRKEVALTVVRPWETYLVLHGLAHHLAHQRGRSDNHGPEFRRALVDVYRIAGFEAHAALLAIDFHEAGLPPATASK